LSRLVRRKIFVGGLPRDTTDGRSIDSFLLVVLVCYACSDPRGLGEAVAIRLCNFGGFLRVGGSGTRGRYSVRIGMRGAFRCSAAMIAWLGLFINYSV